MDQGWTGFGFLLGIVAGANCSFCRNVDVFATPQY